VNANSTGARISERRRANNKAGGPGKLKGGNSDNRVKGPGGGNEAESVPRPTKVGRASSRYVCDILRAAISINALNLLIMSLG